MRWLKRFGLAALLLWTVILNIYHAGVFPHPEVPQNETAKATYLDRRDFGINQLILEGPPFARGKLAGERLAPQMLKLEQTLVGQLRGWIPSDLLLQGLILGAITYFQGVDRYFALSDLQEMYGTSFSAPKEFDTLVDGFTRQVAYHGLHEVGQKMVDQGFEDMGCTVVALPVKDQFVLGRNFDFEGGRIFDTEKIVKWVFPDQGFAFVSVIWAGMVGAVTGVNENGVYISINAAGSADSKRIGTPSTLVLLKVLEEARTSEEALQILREAPMFITDIFVVLDRAGHLYRVEKSSTKMAALPLHGPSVVTNHLIAPEFENDSVNQFRKRELTSLAREARGLQLVQDLKNSDDPQVATRQVLSVLRDKGVGENGQPLNLGNRLAIDALIATHSVIYDSVRGLFFVSQGPAVAGPFQGYDLKASFATRRPVVVESLPADPAVTPEQFAELKEVNQEISRTHRLAQFRSCTQAEQILQSIPAVWREQSPYYHALGDTQLCLHHSHEAHASFERALVLHPSYARFERDLRKKLAQ